MVQKSGENQLRLAEYPHSLQGFISIYIPSGCWPWDFTETINYVGNGAVSLGVSTPTHLRGNESEKPGLLCPKAVNKRSATNSMYCVINSWNPVRGKRVNFGGEFPSIKVSHRGYPYPEANSIKSPWKRAEYPKKEMTFISSSNPVIFRGDVC